ncbi:tubulin nucleotide-binding domain-like protein [Linderina pennispora]|uniref:Tubulin nucleotide-binding domain-like protein n=1 Tax=Linderina pennispora TaxID=61395 RepID=A0A1Y1W1V1_9FUNG|nr:tubulin nucleotide-binding domain-like protein [Linderina pennispora]ORX67501.1 tubulin nucleotide-binding domain-like protein [Linderina pennispora]
MHEIITLQFGESANYVGTHYWNMQQQKLDDPGLSTDVLFRETTAPRGPAQRTPRLLAFDTASNFGLLAIGDEDGNEDETRQIAMQWEGQTETHRAQQPNTSEFQRDHSVEIEPRDIRFWSDFGEVRYSSHSLHPVSGIAHGNSLGEMNTFHEGLDVIDGEDRADDVMDGDFRRVAEDCDCLQGFQVMADMYGGFAGYGCGYLARIRDEYPKKSVLLYSIGNTTVEDMDRGRGMDAAVSLAANLENVSMYVPVSVPSGLAKLFPGVQIQGDSFYHSSALMAMGLDVWGTGLLAGRRVLDEIVSQVTQQEHFKLADLMLAPGLCTESTDLGQILNKDFVAFSGSEIRDSKQLSGHLVIGNGIDIDMAGPSFVPVDSPVRLSRSFPKIFRGIDVHGRRMAVSTLGELTSKAEQLRSTHLEWTWLLWGGRSNYLQTRSG